VVEAHSGELSRALARDGLTLAPIEPPTRDAGTLTSGEGGRSSEERRDAWREAADARDGRPSTEPNRQPAPPQGGQRHHVKA
jgi:hypothetical protein